MSVTGGIQPGVLRRSMGQAERDNGLLAWLLLAWPPETPKRWNETTASDALDAAVLQVFLRLGELDFETGADDDPEPVDLWLEPAASGLWGDFVKDHGERVVEITDEDLRAAWAKLEGATARLALIFHLAAWAASGQPMAGPVGRAALEAAIGLTDWFKHEVERVYQALAEEPGGQRARRVLEAVGRLGGRATSRELMRVLRRDYQGEGAAERAETDLRALSRTGCARWVQREPGPQGGRPVFELVLNDAAGPPPGRWRVDGRPNNDVSASGCVPASGRVPRTSVKSGGEDGLHGCASGHRASRRDTTSSFLRKFEVV